MVFDEIVVQNMGYLLAGTQFETDPFADLKPHHTQQNTKGIKLVLYFVALSPPDEEPRIPRLYSVRVPRGTPIFRLRSLIKYFEMELTKLYGPAQRVNFVYSADEESENWEMQFELPLSGVSYV